MDRMLIDEFREKVNEQDLVCHIYHNHNGKDQWSIICSVMDWIDVVVDSIDTNNLSRKNDNESSIKVITFITCIDVLWEAIQQLHRVFFNNNEIPFVADNSVFKHKLFKATDNDYFKTIRACFAAHPINLNDNFTGANKAERRYASWSGGGFSEGDFSVILYSNQPDKESLYLNIYFDELLAFAEIRYNYLCTVMEEIDMKVGQYFNSWRNQRIMRDDNPAAQIEILVNEAKQRLDNDYYNSELKKLRIIFTTSITNPQNQEVVNYYRIALLHKIEELFICLQQMNFSELQSIDDSYPTNCGYAFSKLSDVVYGNGNSAFIQVENFKTYLGEIVDFSKYKTYEELYVIIKAGFFWMNTNGQKVKKCNLLKIFIKK